MLTVGNGSYRNRSLFIRAWERYYTRHGFTSRRMRWIAAEKGRAGKMPPGEN